MEDRADDGFSTSLSTPKQKKMDHVLGRFFLGNFIEFSDIFSPINSAVCGYFVTKMAQRALPP